MTAIHKFEVTNRMSEKCWDAKGVFDEMALAKHCFSTLLACPKPYEFFIQLERVNSTADIINIGQNNTHFDFLKCF